jgi:hypothetical protein
MSKPYVKVISLTPNLAADSIAATTAYADKDVLGDHLTISGAVSDSGAICKLLSVTARNKVATALALDLFFLDEAPAAAYGDNNSGYALADTDLSKVIGVVSLATGDWSVGNTLNVVASKTNIGLPLKAKAGKKDIYVIVVTRTAITFGAAGDLTIDLGLEQN